MTEGPSHAAPLASAEKRLRHMFIRDLLLDARIGVHPHEWRETQRVRVNMDFAILEGPVTDRLSDVVDYGQMVDAARAVATEGHVQLAETLAERIAERVLIDPRIRLVRVRVEKLDVFAQVGSVGVEIERVNPASEG